MNNEETTDKSEETGAATAELEQEAQVEEVAEDVVKEEEEDDTTEETEEESVEETTEESAEETEESEETPEPITGESFITKAKEMFPNKKFEDEASVYQAMLDYKKNNDEANRRVMEVLTDQPEVGEIIKELANGATFEEALALHVDVEALKPSEGEPDRDVWKEARKKRKEKAKELEKAQKEIEANIAKSGEAMETFRKAKEMTEDETNTFAQAAHEVIKDIQQGLLTDKFLDFMYKGLSWDGALEESRKQGEVKGRNEKIVADKSKKTSGDGLPKVTSKGQPGKSPEKNPIARSIVAHQQKRNRF